MAVSRSLLPDLPDLTGALADLLAAEGYAGRCVTVVERGPNGYQATFPSEIVRCRLGDDRELRLFCKYAGGPGDPGHGHRGGVAYEAQVYRDVLRPLRAPTARCFGAVADG